MRSHLLFVLIFWICLTGFMHPIQAQEIALPSRDSTSILIAAPSVRPIQIKIPAIRRPAQRLDPRLALYEMKPPAIAIRASEVPSFWQRLNQFSFNLSEAAFVNWNAGGDNAISAAAKLLFKRNYAYRNLSWQNELEMRFGWNAQEGRKWRKTDDAIRLTSTFGYRPDTLSNWYYSVKSSFQTQFADGYKYPDRSRPISRFMAPGYFFLGAGASYITKDKSFNLYISPLTHRSTFVLDQELANSGAFGVSKAIVDIDGTILQEGSNVLVSLGFQVTHNWERTLMKNVDFDHRLNLYTDYLRDFGNVDIDWEIEFVFTVNDFIKTRLGSQIIYDDDIRFDVVQDSDGALLDPGVPKVQLRQWLNLGVNFDF